MITFLKTFSVCLIFALGFLFYQFYSKESHSNDVSKVNDMFSIEKEDNEFLLPETPAVKSNTEQSDIPMPMHTCFFYSVNGELTPVTREVQSDDPLKTAILLLLKGPLISETRKGIYSEIPPNVDLINVTVDYEKVIVDLTSNFGNGGGFSSIENRVKQLLATVKNVVKNKDIYLFINGKQVEYLGGDGVYIKQPLE